MLDIKNRDTLAATVFRVLFSLIFLVAGFMHIIFTDKVVTRLSMTPSAHFLMMIMPLKVMVFMAGLGLFAGGLSLLLGFWTRLSSLLLVSILIPITITVQLGGSETLGPLFKNIALLGGLIYFSYFGTQGWSLDKWIGQDTKKKYGLAYAKALLVVALGVTFFPNTSSQASTSQPLNKIQTHKISYAILVSAPGPLKVAVNTLAEGLKGKDGIKMEAATIVVCGNEAIQAVKKGSKIEDVINKAAEMGIRIEACGISMKAAGVEEKDLNPHVVKVPNGLWEMIRLKSQGFTSLEI